MCVCVGAGGFFSPVIYEPLLPSLAAYLMRKRFTCSPRFFGVASLPFCLCFVSEVLFYFVFFFNLRVLDWSIRFHLLRSCDYRLIRSFKFTATRVIIVVHQLVGCLFIIRLNALYYVFSSLSSSFAKGGLRSTGRSRRPWQLTGQAAEIFWICFIVHRVCANLIRLPFVTGIHNVRTCRLGPRIPYEEKKKENRKEKKKIPEASKWLPPTVPTPCMRR